MLCAFSGHRPQRLPWGTREDDPRCAALKIMMERAVDAALERGCTQFMCGMARGCDTYFAEIVLQKGWKLIAALPCPDQAERWPIKDRQRYDSLLCRCSETWTLEPVYTNGCMLRRNRAMIQRADLLISVYDGCGGGTANAVSCAQKKGIEILSVWL